MKPLGARYLGWVMGLLVVVTVVPALGIDTTWTFNGDGNWTEAAKWSNGEPTNDTFDVFIDDGDSAVNVTLNTSRTIGSLTLGTDDTLTIENIDTTDSIIGLTAGAGISNNGSIVLTGSNVNGGNRLVVTDGVFNNNATGQLSFQGSSTHLFTSDLVNNGTVVVDLNTILQKPDGVYVNLGQFTINSSFGITGGGTFELADGVLDLDDGLLTLSASEVGEVNQLIQTGGVFRLNGEMYAFPGGVFTQSGGLLDFQSYSGGTYYPRIRSGTYRYLGGQITGTVWLDGFGSTLEIGPMATEPASFLFFATQFGSLVGDVHSGQTVTIEERDFFSDVTSANGFTNDGTVRLLSSNDGRSTLVITNGQLVNAATGVLHFQEGVPSGSSFSIGAILTGNLVNYGDVVVDHVTAFNKSGGQYTNNGVFTVNRELSISGGTLTNFANNTLSGGTYDVSGDFRFPGANIVTNQAEIILRGELSRIRNQTSGLPDALTNLTVIGPMGALRLFEGRNFTAVAAFTNEGELELGGTTFTAPSLDNASSGEILGFGDLLSPIDNAGTVRAAGGTLNLPSAMGTSDGTLAADDGHTLVVNGNISDGASGNSVTKIGAGTLLLGGTNTYTGPTNINAGTLHTSGGNAIPDTSQVNLADVAGTVLDLDSANETVGNLSGGGASGGNVSLAAGTLSINQSGNTTYAGAVSGTGGITKLGPGTLTLSGTSNYTGGTTISEGMLTVTNSSSLGAIPGGDVIIEDGGMLNLGGGVAGNGALNFGQKVFHIAGNGDGLGAITNRDLVVDPSGNTGGGRQNNVLQWVVLDADASIGGPSNGPDGPENGRIYINANQVGGDNVAELDLAGHNLTKLGPNFFGLTNVDVVGEGDIIVSGAGSTLNLQSATSVLPNGGKILIGDNAIFQFWNVTTAGATKITRPVEMGDGTPSSKSFMGAGGGVSSLGSPITLRGDLIVRPTVNSFANQALVLAGDISQDATPRRLIKSNVGTLILSGNNSFTGGLEINPGTSVVPSNPGTGTVQLGSAAALHPATVVSFAPAAGFTGILQLGGNNTTISGLQATSLAGTALVENANATPATLTVNSVTNTQYEGVVQDGTGGGPIALTKTGGGTLTLGGANTYTGVTTVEEGTLLVSGSHTGLGSYLVEAGATLGGSGTIDGNVDLSGTLAPGASAGALTLGSLAMDSGSMLNIELGGSTPGSQFDRLLVAGNSALDGTLNITLIDDFTPTLGQLFDILDWGSLTGTFASVMLPALSPDLMWSTSALYTDGILKATWASDFDGNGAVDGEDLGRWGANYGIGNNHAQGDANGDGKVNGRDFLIWQRQYGNGAPPLASVSVPEPGGLFTLLVGLLAIPTRSDQCRPLLRIGARSVPEQACLG